MLVLSNVHKLLARALAPPELHTAVLLTPAGQLVSCAADPARCKDDVRAIVGLSGEKWQEAGDRGVGMESPFGRIMVLAVEAPGETGGQGGTGEPWSTVGGGKDEDKGEGEGAGAGVVNTVHHDATLPAAVLVRPDGYVAWADDQPATAAHAAAAIGHWLRPAAQK